MFTNDKKVFMFFSFKNSLFQLFPYSFIEQFLQFLNFGNLTTE